MAASESWVKKNIFSLVNLGVLLIGFVVAYVRLEAKVDQIQRSLVDKEIVRSVAKEVLEDKLAIIMYDTSYIKKELNEQTEINKSLFRRMRESSKVSANDETIYSQIYKTK